MRVPRAFYTGAPPDANPSGASQSDCVGVVARVELKNVPAEIYQPSPSAHENSLPIFATIPFHFVARLPIVDGPTQLAAAVLM